MNEWMNECIRHSDKHTVLLSWTGERKLTFNMETGEGKLLFTVHVVICQHHCSCAVWSQQRFCFGVLIVKVSFVMEDCGRCSPLKLWPVWFSQGQRWALVHLFCHECCSEVLDILWRSGLQVHLLSTLSTQCTQPSVRDVCVCVFMRERACLFVDA